ncbi:MAG: hypothetical protein KA251_09360 [Saprospiraceae bacterium]|nr:hypothetical protein [Candidatus Vicinibacter affinis]MBP6174473.1 hypothetical protein [Saprospiraceae bacterium]MBK6574139.1 hypothetical protein [Candidatus Vicinibacter affinis]MBK6823532.1 hypothetical protein [Candidatus Vicinibacter affinis]MBK7302384.1 hypothetical protein [Candidatus Vicinibacter affinis]
MVEINDELPNTLVVNRYHHILIRTNWNIRDEKVVMITTCKSFIERLVQDKWI